MKKDLLNHFKGKLEAEKVSLTDELNSIARQNPSGDWEAVPTPHADQVDGDEADMAGFIEDFESKIARLNSLETRYVQVEGALKRIDDGSYGTCMKSGKPIEEDRLEANPAAETCKAMMNG